MSNPTLILLVTVLAPVVVALSGDLFQLILAHLPAQRAERVRQIVADVVLATEQALGGAGGAAKKAAALATISALLQRAHLTASAQELDTLLEAAVYGVNAAQAAQAAQAPPPRAPLSPAAARRATQAQATPSAAPAIVPVDAPATSAPSTASGQ